MPANSQPDHDITDATGQPSQKNIGPQSSNTVPAIAQATTDKRSILAKK